MFEKLKEKREARLAKRAKPWNKKQKIIFLSVLGIIVIYVLISSIISGNGISVPKLNLSVNGFDIMLICLLVIGLAVVKIRKHIKNRKDKDK